MNASSALKASCSDIAVCRAREYVWGVLAPTIITVGICGNITIILIFVCPFQVHRKPVLSLTLVMLAIFDIMALVTGFVRHWLRKSFYGGIDVQGLAGSNFVCKTHEFFVYFSLTMATWTLVVISAERFMVVWFRMRATVVLTVKRLTIIFAILIGLAISLHSHFFWTRGILPNGKCGALPGYKHFSRKVMPVIDLTLSTGIPMATVVVLNICILYKLYLRLAENQRLTSQQQAKKYSRIMGSTTKMLLLVILLFILCVLPTKIYIAVLPCKAPTYICAAQDGKEKTTYQIFRLIWTMCLHLQFSNHACNFFIYFLTSTSFRNDLKRTYLLWVCRRCCADRLIMYLDSDRQTDLGEYQRANSLTSFANYNIRTGDTFLQGRTSCISFQPRTPSPRTFRKSDLQQQRFIQSLLH